MRRKILILTDNEELLNRFRKLVQDLEIASRNNLIFEYCFSFNNKVLTDKYKDADWFKPLKVKDEIHNLIAEYAMIISLHCKQLFPSELVRKVKCINVHPGLNPYNRGWYPQVFSIINGMPCGATIHEMDEELDHGGVICQKEVTIDMSDTSFTVYNRVLEVEIELLSENLERILRLDYETFSAGEGKLNLRKDFDALCEIHLDHKDTFRNHINVLRALTHGNYSNAYFLDEHGNKIFLKLEIRKENKGN